jgi:hypothetical protein
MLKHAIIGTLLSFSLSAGALAEEAASGKQVAPNHNVGDPNERICENITPIGSRLATKRFCGTRAEWADRKRQDREALEGAQKSPCMITRTSGTGRAAC